MGEGVVQARVWTRKRLAELCGISEQQVVEWAILVGNDYTREFSFSAIGFGSHRNRKPEKVRAGLVFFTAAKWRLDLGLFDVCLTLCQKERVPIPCVYITPVYFLRRSCFFFATA